MAITINGSGTITGISTGGLPDGIVDDGTLASSAVTSTKIADGTITNSDINASAAIAASKLSGTGKVLQVVSAENSTDVTLGSTVSGTYYEYLQASITPSSSTSKIAIFHDAYGNLSGGNYKAIHLAVYRGATSIKDIRYFGYEGPTNVHLIMVQPITLLDSPTTASAITYYFKAANATGSSASGTYSGKMNVYNSSRVILMEIAQ